MRQMLKEIQSGEYARKWVAEHEAGRPWFNAQRASGRNQLLERVGADLREMMPFVNPVKAPDQSAR
jgi:ketol-acid reductoisomerase